jgi:mevalonate kinase
VISESGTSAIGYAPGKLILSGEHAVVHGHLCLALAVTLGTTVTLTRREGPTGIDDAPFSDARLDDALSAILPPEGIGVAIETDLPVGRGMGSSAALAVALVRARAVLSGRVADFEECHREGFAIERVFHGNPSGVDHTVSAMGGGVKYRRGQPITPLPLPPLTLVVMDTGIAGNTAELVAGVAALPDGTALLSEIGALTEAVADALHGPPDALGALLTENHRLLRGIGVSSPLLDALVGAALSAGAYGAKLAGAGGGGVALALVADPEPVLRAARALGAEAFVARVAPATGAVG